MIGEEIAYNADAFRKVVVSILEESDDNALVPFLSLKGMRAADIGRELIAIGKTGEAELEKLMGGNGNDNPKLAHDFALGIMRRFAPFADIIRDIIPRGVWRLGWKDNPKHHRLMDFAEGSAYLKAKREREAAAAQRVAYLNATITYKEAAKSLNVTPNAISNYVHRRRLVAVRDENSGAGVGVTRASVINLAKVRRGVCFSAVGDKFKVGEYVTSKVAREILGRGKSAIRKLANDGRLVRVYRFYAKGSECFGYTRESVEEVKRDLEAVVFFTANGGKVYVSERMSKDEVRKRIGRRGSFISALGDTGILERVYLDPNLKRSYGYTRASVVAYLQANPPKVSARAAVAVGGFGVEELPPVPRLPRCLADCDDAARSEDERPDDTKTAATPAPHKHRLQICFHLTEITTAETEDNMDEPTKEKTEQTNTASEHAGLKVAKSFIIHEGTEIRAICVSESDRDNILAALKFYRKYKDRESEIESAVALLNFAKEKVGINSPAETAAKDE